MAADEKSLYQMCWKFLAADGKGPGCLIRETYGSWYSGLGVLKNSYGTKNWSGTWKCIKLFSLLNKSRFAIICRGPNHSPPLPQRLPNCEFALFFPSVLPMAFGSCFADPTLLQTPVTRTWLDICHQSLWECDAYCIQVAFDIQLQAGRQVVFSGSTIEDLEEIKEGNWYSFS